MTLPAYGIFEGGGAKGLAHIAGAAAAERNGLEFIGVAGASAGALVAALLAVGYRADDLFDPDNPAANLLQRHGISPLSLLGATRWKTFEKAGAQSRRAAAATLLGGALCARLVAWTAASVAKEIRRDGGYFATDEIRDRLNYFLRTKLTRHHAEAGRAIDVPERVRFRDMDPKIAPECCSLKIIVTDISRQAMVVFDNSPEYGDVEVAEAVCASISIPFIFKPAKIPSYAEQPQSLYADGGLVSNLPIWVFAEEKLNFERTQTPNARVPVVAFSLAETDDDRTAGSALAGSLGYLSNLARSAIFGGQKVATRFVADLLPVSMPIGLGTTEFDFDAPRAIAEYNRAYAAAVMKLGRQVRIRPAESRKILEYFLGKVIEEARPHGGVEERDHLRVSIIEPFGMFSFRVIQSLHMDQDADDRLVFSKLAIGAPDAFNKRAPSFLDFSAVWNSGGSVSSMTKYEVALLRRSLRSAICIPIFKDEKAWQEPDPARREEPLGVVSIDSDGDLEQLYNNVVFLQTLIIFTLPLSAVLQP